MMNAKCCLLIFFSGVFVALSAPVAKRMIDLTYVFDNDTLHHPMHKKFELYVTFNGTYKDDIWLQLEEYASATHAGTHMDAPCHFIKNGWSIDQIPLDRFMAPAAVVDVEAKAKENSNYEVTVADLMHWEAETGQVLNHVILLIRSGWGKRWGYKELFTGTADDDISKLHHPGMSGEAAQWLVDNRNIYGIGIDTLSFDCGQCHEFLTHRILLGQNIYGLENVANLDLLPLYGAKLYVMPMKIGAASGAPTRIIATLPHIVYAK